MKKLLLIAIGSALVGVGALGVVVPGLPTTIFLILAAGCYIRSSDRLYNWLVRHRVFGPSIRRFQEKRAMTRRSKAVAMISMWSMIGLSEFLLWGRTAIQIVLVILGIAGTVSIGWIVRTDDESLDPNSGS
jgi:uncharacterized membrane protein YbaN (DUF454 family)